MKKDIHNDELDDFLEQHLSSYSENPPDDLWNSIESGLPSDVPPGKRVYKLPPYSVWIAAASIALLIGFMTCQHFYYQHQLDALQRQIDQHAAARMQQPAPSTKLPETSPVADNKTVALAPPTQLGNNAPAIVASPLLSSTDRMPPGLTFQVEADKAEAPAVPAEALVMESRPAQASPKNTWPDEILTIRVTPCIPGPIPFLRSGSLAISPVAKPVFTGNPKGKWSLLAHTAYLMEKTKVTAERFAPGGPGGPRSFREDRTAQGQVLFAGLGLERKLNRRFSFVSGAAFQQVTRTAGHEAKLRFGDRHPHSPGGQHPQHEFSYQLNTSSGAMAVDVRVSEVDSSVQIPDQEEINLNIQRQETTQYLTVPILAKVGFGTQRVRAYAKGGILTDILLRNDNKITDISSLNPRFRVEPGAPPKASKSELKPVSFSYLAAAGLEIGLTPRLSFQLEPTLIGGLSPRQQDTDVAVSRMSAGLNAGLRLQF